MFSKPILLVVCVGFLLGGCLTTTTTTFVAAMSISNPDIERYFRTNMTHPFIPMSEERVAVDLYTYAFLEYKYNETPVTFNEEKARYGEGKIASVHGKLVHISRADKPEDDFACTPNILGTRGAPTPPAGVHWIALVRRGRCTFEEKVKNVYEKGAYGVIIYNDKPVTNLEKMQIKGKFRDITAVITYQDIGEGMANRLDEGYDVYCNITEGRTGARPINNLNRTSVLFVSISFIVLMVISLVWLIFYYIQRFRYLQSKDQQSRQLCSVTKKAIMKIPTRTGKNTDEKDIDSDCCAICIEAYKASDCIRVLPCKHEFHKNCIDPWLIEHRTCPMCKLDVLKFYGYVVGDQIHTTPSPQHIPPNVEPINDNDVPVVVVAIPHAAPQQQLQQQQQQQLLPTIQQALRTSLLSPFDSGSGLGSGSAPLATSSPSSTTTAIATTASSCATSVQPNNLSNNTGCASGNVSGSGINSHNRNLSCSISKNNHPHVISTCRQHQQQQHHPNCCCSSNFNDNSNSNQNRNEPLVKSISGNDGVRRNSAPQVMQVSTASRQFIGSEESIFEFDVERENFAATASTSNATQSTPAMEMEPHRNDVLSNIIKSRDFVIDFPRIFVLDAGSNADDVRASLFPNRLPERSQSSLSLTRSHSRDWMSLTTNKLENQQGPRRVCKPSLRYEMQENLLGVRTDSVRQRRSRSADGRYSNGYFARKELASKQQQEQRNELSTKDAGITGELAILRRNSDALYELTDASYAQSKQRQMETHYRGASIARESDQSTDVKIKIQVNGEGVSFEE